MTLLSTGHFFRDTSPTQSRVPTSQTAQSIIPFLNTSAAAVMRLTRKPLSRILISKALNNKSTSSGQLSLFVSLAYDFTVFIAEYFLDFHMYSAALLAAFGRYPQGGLCEARLFLTWRSNLEDYFLGLLCILSERVRYNAITIRLLSVHSCDTAHQICQPNLLKCNTATEANVGV